jgi:hypothetical protein
MDNGGGWGNTSGVALTSGGWVASLEANQKAGSILIRDLQGHVPAGTYTLMWDGDGLVDCASWDVETVRCGRGTACALFEPVPRAPVLPTNPFARCAACSCFRHIAPGLAEIDVKPSTNGNNGIFCTVERANPANPPRNIRVLMPGVDAATAEALPFHPRLLNSLKEFGVLRFMEMMFAGRTGARTWAQRSKPTDRLVARCGREGLMRTEAGPATRDASLTDARLPAVLQCIPAGRLQRRTVVWLWNTW